MATPDWSQLPSEVLAKIAEKHLDTNFDYLRFRSACHSWRSSSTSATNFPTELLHPNSSHLLHPNSSLSFCTFVSNSIYSLQPINQPQIKPWIIKVEEKRPNVLQLKDPLSTSSFKSFPNTFPKVFNILDFKICCLGKEYALVESDSQMQVEELYQGLEIRRWLAEVGNFKVKKVGLLSPTKTWFEVESVVLSPIPTRDDFVVMATQMRHLMSFRGGDEAWSFELGDENTRFLDIIHYKKQFYTVDKTGRACIADPRTPSLSMIANPLVNDGLLKRLIEWNGELFLVDIYIYSVHPGRSFETLTIPNGCKVYKLDEVKHEWIRVNKLNDCLFFVGDESSLSILTAEFLPRCKGNCILLTYECFYDDHGDEDSWNHCIGVFNMEDGSFRKLRDYPSLLQLFWPPPTWFVPPNSD
ncbi:hypothetical protein AQUCO_01300882v1 [Aquilegia coerulea]|uniref:KIB1-4 beta-propeller domain-containing protein n=1 Tax=Aquilegia coerulea TaxID=218851 RepID=A0A2G5E3V9_AQUCA|nr:hypothetical protein AQUCO_01300882v1 [Aquilegia coerulea]